MAAPIKRRHRGTFSQTATTAEIEAQLASRRTDRRALDRDIAWLEGLLERRRQQNGGAE